jgi:histidinol-phosphate aminotransferase
MYGFLARLGGAEVVPVARGEGFAVDIAGIEAAVRAGATMVFLASPNNPTGNSLSASEVERLAALEALVVIDEAYVEFGGNSCVPAMARHANLVVLRTFSKWAALAGLRVGYAVVDRELARRMMAIKQPYNVNVAADVAARAALAHRAEIAEDVACIVAERERLFRALEAIPWLTPFPSEANFVLAAVDGRDARAVRDSLRRRGILIRHYDVPELQGFIRISAGRPEDTDRLLAALEELDL